MNSFKLIGFVALAFIITVTGSILWSAGLHRNYPDLPTADALNDTIENVVQDVRASARVTFQSGKKFSLPWAKIVAGDQVVNLPRVVKKGDILIKEQFSDTITLIQNGKIYTFVARKYIR